MRKQLAKGARVAILCAIILAMIVGSVYDYRISKELYNTAGKFGVFFAAYGPAPNYLLAVWTGVLLMVHSHPVKESTAKVQRAFGAFLAAAGTMVLGYAAAKYIPGMHIAVSVLIACGISFVTSLFILYMVKETSYRNIIKLCVVMVIMAAAGPVIVNLIKTPWSRPRMRLISSEAGIAAGLQFQPWYHFGNSLKETMIAAGTKADDFKSFPSGHTAAAACSLALYFIASVSPKFEKKKHRILVLALIWTGLTALSRIVVGAHFLTDVTMGFAIEFLIFVIVGGVMRFARQN